MIGIACTIVVLAATLLFVEFKLRDRRDTVHHARKVRETAVVQSSWIALAWMRQFDEDGVKYTVHSDVSDAGWYFEIHS